MFFKKSNYILPAKASISISTYRFIVVVSLVALFVVFSSSYDGYCSLNAHAAIEKKDALGCLEYWLNRYQSLIGGLLALLGAGLAFSAVRSQIAQTERLASFARRRKEGGATAVAPFALSAMVDYAWKCMDVIIDARSQVTMRVSHPSFNVPKVPQEIILLLRDYVEFGDENNAKAASNLLLATQIQQSRMNSLKSKTVPSGPGLHGDIELEDAMFDVLDLHAQVSALFRPIRGDYSDRDLRIEEMYNDLRVRGLELSEWPRVKWKIEAFERAQTNRRDKTAT